MKTSLSAPPDAIRRAWSLAALGYFETHGIDPAVAVRAHVSESRGALMFPVVTATGMFFRRRLLRAGLAKCLQPAGRPLASWWPLWPPHFVPVVLLTEGEGDALAAITALSLWNDSPMPEHAVAALPGTAMPVSRVVAEMQRVEARRVYLAFDGDAAGRKLTDALSAELASRARIETARLPIPEGRDLADVMAAVDLRRRGRRLARLIVEADEAALL